MKRLIFFFLLLPLIVFAQEKIDLNTATSKELEELSGIGPTYAQRIIDARPFSSIDDLIKIKGIGEKTLQKIKDQGLAYMAEKPEPVAEVLLRPLESYSGGVVFNEVLPSPEGADSENEWIELYNSNNSEIDLAGWKIKDTTGSVKEYIINNKVPSLGYLVFKRPETVITLNNDSDGLILLNPNEEVVDSINFGKAVQSQSYIRTSSNWTWTTTPTPNSPNLKTLKDEVGPRPLAQKETTNISEKLAPRQGGAPTKSAKLVENLERSSKFSVVFVGFLIALCSSVAFLIIKNNLKNFWY